jgi:hypothetical protein
MSSDKRAGQPVQRELTCCDISDLLEGEVRKDESVENIDTELIAGPAP